MSRLRAGVARGGREDPAALGSSAFTIPPRGHGRPPGSVGGLRPGRASRGRGPARSPRPRPRRPPAPSRSKSERLADSVGVERAVELEVLVGQVRQDRHVVRDLPDPLEREPVRGRLDDGGDVAGGHDRAEGALELGRLGRRDVGEAPAPTASPIFCSAVLSRPVRTPAASRAATAIAGGRRLAIRARDADHAERGRGILVPPGGHRGERVLAAVDHELDGGPDLARRAGTFDDDARRPRRGRRPRRTHGRRACARERPRSSRPAATRRES